MCIDLHYFLIASKSGNLSDITVGFHNFNKLNIKASSSSFTSSSYHLLLCYGLPTTKNNFDENINQLIDEKYEVLLQNRHKAGPVYFSNVIGIQLPIQIAKNMEFTSNFDNLTLVLLVMNESAISSKSSKFILTSDSNLLSKIYIYYF